MVMAYEINPLILKKLDSLNLPADFKTMIIELLDFEKNKLNYQESKWKEFYESRLTGYTEKKTGGLKLTEMPKVESKIKAEQLIPKAKKRKRREVADKKEKPRSKTFRKAEGKAKQKKPDKMKRRKSRGRGRRSR